MLSRIQKQYGLNDIDLVEELNLDRIRAPFPCSKITLKDIKDFKKGRGRSKYGIFKGNKDFIFYNFIIRNKSQTSQNLRKRPL